VLVVVFPRAQSLDVIGAVEVLADANRQAEARGTPPSYAIQIAAPVAGPVETSSGIPILAELRLDQISGCVDTLIIGSGRGAREAVANAEVLGELKRLAVSAPRVVSICTGAFPLAATGLLDGRRAATHWEVS
jgi:transcriptional regulator GlxA family with amidase domain